MSRSRRPPPEPNEMFGELTILCEASRHPRSGERMWLVRCTCGVEFERRQACLLDGSSQRCRACAYAMASRSMQKKTREERFWAKVAKGAGCWEWQGGRVSEGYGLLFERRETAESGKRRQVFEYAHRISWELHYGPIPAGKDVLHKCDEPPCCNPQHLFLGDATDNALDMCSKGRHRNYVLTEEQKQQAREDFKTGKATRKQLAEKYGVTYQSMHYTVTRGAVH